MRAQSKFNSRAVPIPDAVFAGGNHSEDVLAMRDVGVIGGSPRSGVHPLRIESFQLVFEADFLGGEKSQRRIVKLELSLSRTSFNSRLEVLDLLVD